MKRGVRIMFELVLYGVGFFLITLLIQYILSSIKKKRRSVSHVWTGINAVISICAMGIVFKEINYFAAVIGFLLADEIGKSNGWH